MPRLSLLVLLLSPALLHAQRGCPCPDSASLFLQLDPTPWDVWPEATSLGTGMKYPLRIKIPK
jgi:hypothetical protein